MQTLALDDLFDVPDACVAEFREKGHTVVRGLATGEEVAAWRPVIERAASERTLEQRPIEERDTYGKAFLQTPNLWRSHDPVKGFVLSRRFAAVAAALIEVPAIRLYRDQALFKEPGGGFTPWHQDQNYWPLETDRTVTMWMALVDIPAEVGSMTFASGSQNHHDLGGGSPSDESEAHFDRLLAERGLSTECYGAMAAGDATFHAGWTLHRAGPNPSENMRAVMTITYFADGARIAVPQSPEQENDRRYWLRLAPGELATSPVNPVVYP